MISTAKLTKMIESTIKFNNIENLYMIDDGIDTLTRVLKCTSYQNNRSEHNMWCDKLILTL